VSATPRGNLAGRHAVVTGASRGIGAAAAAELARRGARVTLVGRDLATLAPRGAELEAAGAESFAVACDLADAAAIPAALAQAAARFGPIEILVNNAGQGAAGSFMDTGPEVWERMLAVNLLGPVHCIRAVLPAMLEAGRGRIVNVASMAGLKGYGRVGAYAASKHALVGLTRSLAIEVRKRGITVNAVCPGYTETAMSEAAERSIVQGLGKSAAEARAMLIRANPRGEIIQPVEVARTIAWLCSDAAGALTGQAIPVAGGET